MHITTQRFAHFLKQIIRNHYRICWKCAICHFINCYVYFAFSLYFSLILYTCSLVACQPFWWTIRPMIRVESKLAVKRERTPKPIAPRFRRVSTYARVDDRKRLHLHACQCVVKLETEMAQFSVWLNVRQTKWLRRSSLQTTRERHVSMVEGCRSYR